MDARTRAREVLAEFDAWDFHAGPMVSPRGLATAVRNLLAETPPALTEGERKMMDAQRQRLRDGYLGDASCLLAILDAHFPAPEPAHKPCPFCGGRGEAFGLRTSAPHIRCVECEGRIGAATEAEAWGRWDRREGMA